MKEKVYVDKCPCCGSTRLYEPTTMTTLTDRGIEKGDVKYIVCEGCGQYIKLKYETFPNYEIVDTIRIYFHNYCKKMAETTLKHYGFKKQKTDVMKKLSELQETIAKEIDSKNDIFMARCFFSDVCKKMAEVYFGLLQLQEIYGFTEAEINGEMAEVIDKTKKNIRAR